MVAIRPAYTFMVALTVLFALACKGQTEGATEPGGAAPEAAPTNKPAPVDAATQTPEAVPVDVVVQADEADEEPMLKIDIVLSVPVADVVAEASADLAAAAPEAVGVDVVAAPVADVAAQPAADIAAPLVDALAQPSDVVEQALDVAPQAAEVATPPPVDAGPVAANDVVAAKPADPEVQVDPVASRKVFDEFTTFVKDGNFEKGILLLEEWLKQTPMDLVNRQNLIHVLLKLERYEKALPHLSFMVDEAGNKGEWLGHYGRTLAKLGEFSKAARILDAAVDARPEDIDLRLDLARIHATRKDYAAARAVLNDALTIEKKIPDVLKELAAVLVELGEYNDALKSYRRLQLLEPTYETALTMGKIASQYDRCDDVVDALAVWEKDFVDETPHLLLGACALKAKERLKAQKHFLQGLKNNDKCYYCALWMGDLYFDLQDWPNAVKYYAMAAPINPRDHRAFLQLGKTLANQGNHIRAARSLQKADERKPNDAEILYMLGLELVRAGERKDAWDIWAKLEPLDRPKANEIKALLVQ